MEEPQFPWWVVVFVLVFGSCFAALKWAARKYLLEAEHRHFPLPLWVDFILVLLILIPLVLINL